MRQVRAGRKEGSVVVVVVKSRPPTPSCGSIPASLSACQGDTGQRLGCKHAGLAGRGPDGETMKVSQRLRPAAQTWPACSELS